MNKQKLAKELMELAEGLLDSQRYKRTAGIGVMTKGQQEAYDGFELALSDIMNQGILSRSQVAKIHHMLKKNMRGMAMPPIVKGFEKYFFDFYGEHGIYPIIGLNKEVFRKALKKYLKISRHDFQGDSVDREHVRDIVYEILGG